MRTRLAVVATGLLAIALLIAGATVLLVLNNSLTSATDSVTSARAQLIADAIETEGVNRIDGELLVTTPDIDVVQILGPGSQVLRSNHAGQGKALTLSVAPGAHTTIGDATSGVGVDYRLSVIGVNSPAGPVTVVVGAGEGPIHKVVLTVALLLSVVFPILLVLLVVAVYYFVGRALASVEQIRAEVADMSVRKSVGRVAVPDTDDEIATLAVTMNDLLDRIGTARERQLQFVGDASHELRSPLTTIVGLSDLSRVTGDAIDAETVRDILHPEAIRLQRMVDDLLLLARADEAGLSIDARAVDLDDVVAAEGRRVEALSGSDIRVSIEPVQVTGDRDMLVRALRNVVDNAVRHTESSVTVTLRGDADRASIQVTDDGPGIPDADKPRVTERFVRLDSSRARRGTGAGLGLAIVAEIVHAHRGILRIDDASGRGTTVTIELPR